MFSDIALRFNEEVKVENFEKVRILDLEKFWISETSSNLPVTHIQLLLFSFSFHKQQINSDELSRL